MKTHALAAEIHVYNFKNSVKRIEKYFFQNNYEPIIIPCRTPKSSA